MTNRELGNPDFSSAPGGRRDKRYRIRMRAVLSLGNEQLELPTGDVSLRGLFLRTDRPLNPHQFVRLDLRLPLGDVPLSLFGSVVHSVPPPGTPERAPGLGIELYGNGPEELKRWHEFIAAIERHHPESTEREVDLCPSSGGDAPEPIRRRFPRFEAELQVRGYFGELDDLVLMYTRDISKGGMFVRTNAVVDVGSSLSLQLVHPLTGLQFLLRCIVRRVVVDRERGMGVEFQDMNTQRRNQLWDFISSGVPSVPADDAEAAPAPTKPAPASGNSPAPLEPGPGMPPASLPTYMAVNVGGRPAVGSAAVPTYMPPPLRPLRRPPDSPPTRGRYP